MKKKKKIAIVMLLVLITLVGCQKESIKETGKETEKEYTQFSEKVPNASDYAGDVSQGDSVGYGILNSDGKVETDNVYYLEQEDAFKRFINIGNFMGRDMSYKLLVFDNYEQMEFEVEQKKTDVCSVYIEKGKELSIPVTLTGLKKGMNDIIFLIVFNAEDNLSEEERLDTSDFNTDYLRCTIYVKDQGIPDYKVSEEDVDIVDEPVSLMVHKKEEEKNKLLLTEQVKKGEELCNYLTIGNEEEEGDFAVIYLEDWKQKELKGEKVKFFHLPENGQITFRMSNTYTERGEHEITVLKIKNIYKESESSINDVESSARILIEVQ